MLSRPRPLLRSYLQWVARDAGGESVILFGRCSHRQVSHAPLYSPHRHTQTGPNGLTGEGEACSWEGNMLKGSGSVGGGKGWWK